MAEAPSLPIIEEEEIGDEFYDKIEAPKFVDFTAPEIHRSHEDRYWFCLRVGCDQNHGEELDSEAIYKNFVLRVMAARSPNVRLRKALNKRATSANLKCPNTAPAKSSKPRVSRLALISSMSQKMVDNNVRTRPLTKVSATPNAKVKQSSATAKALTTPRNQKKVSNLEQFRTVQSKKPAMNVDVPKNRLVAKTLVFHSPRKVVKIKSSVELKTPVKSLCSAMKKLDLDSVKKNLPVAASRKKVRGREVKSRVFDSLYSNSRKVQEAKSLKKVEDLQKCQGPQLHEGADDDSSDMEIDEKSRGSLGRCPESDASGAVNDLSVKTQEPTLVSSEEAENKTSEECENAEKRKPVSENGRIPEARKRNDGKENEGEELTENGERSRGGSLGRCPESDASGAVNDLSVKTQEPTLVSSEEAENKTSEEYENAEKRKPVSENGRIPEVRKRNDDKENEGEELTENDEKENADKRNPVSENGKIPEAKKRNGDDKENQGEELTGNDEKENALAPDENRALLINGDNLKKTKHEDSRKIQKKSTSNATGSQVVKYRKLKPTNPKPFKLRTDERGILKEANLEKKPLSPLKETTANGGKAMRKPQNIQHKNERDSDNNSCGERLDHATQDQSVSIRCTVLDNSNVKVKNKLSAAPHRSAGSKLQKPIDLAERLKQRDKAAQKLDDKFKRKSQMMQPKFARPRGALSRKKENVLLATPGKLSVIDEKSSNSLQPKEAAKPCKNDASPKSKASGATSSSSCSRGRRATTIPKEPNFHTLHVPKSCTKKLT